MHTDKLIPVAVPASLAREQFPAMAGMLTGLALSLTPSALKSRLIDPEREQRMQAAAPSDKLLRHYLAWSGAPASRYAGGLPPHFFARYGMALVARLMGQVPYSMLSVLNQGCRFQVRKLIPQGERIVMRGRLLDCSQHGSRVRVHAQVTAGWAAEPDAMTVDVYAAVMLGRQAKRQQTPRPDPPFETVGRWAADRKDGQRFFYLTGDFNPIHTLWPVARRTRYGGCILHGFGSLARSWECLADAGHEIVDFDLRFVRPNRLPNPALEVQRTVEADAEGYRQMRLCDPAGSVFLAGRFLDRAAAG